MQKAHRSKYRDYMIRYFRTHADTLISAREIYDRMNADGITVNLVTVYRNLDRLTEDRILSRHRMCGTEEYSYQYLSQEMSCGQHLHLYCKNCGRVLHLTCSFMQEISGHLMAEHGFALDCHDSMLVGICQDCRRLLAEQGAETNRKEDSNA